MTAEGENVRRVCGVECVQSEQGAGILVCNMITMLDRKPLIYVLTPYYGNHGIV